MKRKYGYMTAKEYKKRITKIEKEIKQGLWFYETNDYGYQRLDFAEYEKFKNILDLEIISDSCFKVIDTKYSRIDFVLAEFTFDYEKFQNKYGEFYKIASRWLEK